MELRPIRNSQRIIQEDQFNNTFDAGKNGKVCCVTFVNKGTNSRVFLVIPGVNFLLENKNDFIVFNAPQGTYDLTEYKVFFADTGVVAPTIKNCTILIQKYVEQNHSKL
jgi:hypothetical protein